jgi:outer membrane protein assembly factor BamB
VLVGNRVFAGSNDGNVYALDVATGKEVWRFTTGGPVTASPAVAQNRLVIGGEDGKLYCFGEKR